MEFLRIRKVPIEERPKCSSVPNIVSVLRGAAAKDRDIMEKGLRAFVSYIRAYKEHHCTFIFKWKQLEAGLAAMGFGLLQLPSMPELKRNVLSIAGFQPAKGIDVSSIAFKEKAREKQRQKNLANKPPRQPREPEPDRAPKKERKETAEKRRLHQKVEDDEEMNREYRLLKKLKKGTLSESEYEQVMSMPDMQLVEPSSNVDEVQDSTHLNGRGSDSKLSKRFARSTSRSQSKFKNRSVASTSKKRQA